MATQVFADLLPEARLLTSLCPHGISRQSQDCTFQSEVLWQICFVCSHPCPGAGTKTGRTTASTEGGRSQVLGLHTPGLVNWPCPGGALASAVPTAPGGVCGARGGGGQHRE